MLTSTRPNKCKHCRQRMPADKARHVIHEDCIQPWLAVQNAKKAAKAKKEAAAKVRVEKALTRKQREDQKTWADWHAAAQKAVNAFVRMRDAHIPCISCRCPWDATFQAGHYRSRGAAKNLALDVRNIHGQCVQCNLHKHSNALDYRIGFVERYGSEVVEAVEADNAPRHHSVDDLKAIRAEFDQKTKQLKKENA